MQKLIHKIDDIRGTVKKIGKSNLDENFNLKNINLRSYQQDGIKWLIERYESNIGCILADEMGLGKTCQTIGLILYVSNKKPNKNKILIVAPLSVVNNWSDELTRFAPSIKYLIYKGDKDARVELQDKIKNDSKIDIILTSYDLLLKDDFIFEKMNWELLVVDEAHRLKNSNSLLYQCLDSFNIKHRVLLTGTPIQNNLNELYNLLNFIQANTFKVKYRENFIEKYTNTKNEDYLTELTSLLQPFILRRMKSQVNINLPDKLEVILYHGLTDLQKKLYKAVLLKDIGAFNDSKKVRLNNVLMQLRKICSHPYIIPGVEPEPFEIGEHLIETSDKFLLLDSLLDYLYKNNHKVLIFSQFTLVLDIVQDYLSYRQYNYERLDGSVRGEERNLAIENFSKTKETFIFLLSTKAGGVGINLVSADTCIFMDNDWNPMNDIQAAARAHRIGQHRPVMIIRLIAQSTVEEIIYKRANAKLQLSNEIMESGQLANTLDANTIDISNIIKYGLDQLFNGTKQNDFKTIEFEGLLVPTKNGRWLINEKSIKNEKLVEEVEDLPKTMYEFEGTDYSKDIEASEKDEEQFKALLKTTDDVIINDVGKRKREMIKIYDEETNKELDAATKLAKKQKAEENKKRKAELLKKKWDDNNYVSKNLKFEENELEIESYDDDLDYNDTDTKYLHYVKGDVSEPVYAKNHNAIIVHCVDNSGKWGTGGIFDALNKRDNKIAISYKLAHEMSDLNSDDVHLYEIDDRKYSDFTNGKDYVALICAQKRDKHGYLSAINLKSIEVCFNKIYLQAKILNASVHLPRIGHRNVGSYWYGIEKLIKKCFVLRKIHSFIYYFERNKNKSIKKIKIDDDDDDEDMQVDEPKVVLQKNTQEIDQKVDKINKILPNIFSNICFYFYGDFKNDEYLIDIDLMKRYIIAYDGTIEQHESEHVSHVITNEENYKKLKNDNELLKTFKMAVFVNFEWIQNCLLRKRLLSIDSYKLN